MTADTSVQVQPKWAPGNTLRAAFREAAEKFHYSCGRHLFRVHVAKELDVSAGTIKNWEMNRTTVAPRFLPRVVAFLGYDPEKGVSELPGTDAVPEGAET